MESLREAVPDDVPALRAFAEDCVRPHYASLIGVEAAAGQVRAWWNEKRLGSAIADGLVVVAVDGDRVVGVAQRGRSGEDHAVYKLYALPEFRGRGLGVRLLAALTEALPDDARWLHVEHFEANGRAGAFYEREGFAVRKVEPSRDGDPALAVVWRAREIARG
ncbi:GNAT family N-acetyltransferase [Actinosynnema pretiosum subsp. pretiosum]|uniref:GCN5-related N-acetyltransferase n=2 Tax=Actinosynnema TaxID=40566 RepID=C6WAX1_ACTMD|nr:GNAT family N-acetyltransferase [Actinosynnema mirum]ACU37440.1 GCN5-related N-acetyltransferase [Actinosynnema mirum DSM 43827]AXX30913.1 hypothetical protein APASM_3548 [Actinosynnema pretiosum subsp. pretiosum]QUF04986.1 GNAT family N-acetyltransferase [Actinosynnema pretiosum subsp. pretiosum]